MCVPCIALALLSVPQNSTKIARVLASCMQGFCLNIVASAFRKQPKIPSPKPCPKPSHCNSLGLLSLQVCKKLSELHMIKIEKKTVHRDDEFRDVQANTALKLKPATPDMGLDLHFRRSLHFRIIYIFYYDGFRV